jgi:hypothetical protein
VAFGCSCFLFAPSAALALNGGTLRVTPRNSWRAFEVITVGNDPAGDGFAYAMPGTFDGVGAWISDPSTQSNLRLSINHEATDASVSEVNLSLTNFRTAIANTISGGTPGGVNFVTSARQAYGRWSSNGGGSYTSTSDITTTAFQRFCSGQLHPANTFGTNRGFVDPIYMCGEEVAGGRLFALDMTNRDFYALTSTTVGVAPGGVAVSGAGGVPADPWENACLLDTGETNHAAILLSPDGGSQAMQVYIGQKGKGFNGTASNSFLARNGLAYGNYYYLNNTLPGSGTSPGGTIDTTLAGALVSAKLEDVDTNPNNPKQAVIGIQETGLFTFDLDLKFNGAGGTFNPGGSSFSVTKVLNHNNNIDGLFGDADNVDWTVATTLNDVNYANGLIFVNEDSDTANGETWMTTPSGTGPTLIADTIAFAGATETSGVLDVSRLVGYRPGSVVLTSNQGTDSSLSVLINPFATLEPRHWDVNGMTAGAGGASPTGNWDGSTSNFNTDSTGAAGGIVVADTTALDTVVFGAGSDATGSYTVTLSGTRAAARINIEDGHVTLTGGSLTVGVFDVSAGAVGTVTSNLTAPGSSLTKTGPGTLEMSRLPLNHAVTITDGTLRVLESAPGLSSGVPSGNDGFVSRASSLTIDPGATLDLTNNDLIVDYTGSSPFASLNDMVRSGFNFGDWLGDGITSSTAANPLSNGNYALGIAENGLLTNPFGGDAPGGLNPKFSGQTVDNTTVLIKFTHRVDLDLDGLVTGNDAAIFNGAYSEGEGGATWQTGDVDYDGTWSSNDAAIFNSFYDESLAHLPEPGTAAAASLALLGLAAARKKRRHV